MTTFLQMVQAELRPAAPEDSDFCFGLHEATMRPMIERLYGPWDREVQQGFHDRWFQVQKIRIISVGEQPIGVIGVDDAGDDVYVTRIEVLPEWQNRGIGTQVLRRIRAEGGRFGKSVSLHVFKESRALALYRRLGFRPVSENGTRVLMRATLDSG